MARLPVSLTFDHDAISGWITRGCTTPAPVSRGGFGVVGTQRLLAAELGARFCRVDAVAEEYDRRAPFTGNGP